MFATHDHLRQIKRFAPKAVNVANQPEHKTESPAASVQAIDEVISGDARALSANLQMLREKLFPPEAKSSSGSFLVEKRPSLSG